MRISIFRDITLCILMKVNRHLEGQLFLLPASCWFLAWLIVQPCRIRRHVSPKHRLTFSGIHGVTSWKSIFCHVCGLITNALKKTRKETKIKIFKTMALPMFSHSSEVWTQKQEAATTQRKVLTYAVQCKLKKMQK
jgi:hypothetical protein